MTEAPATITTITPTATNTPAATNTPTATNTTTTGPTSTDETPDAVRDTTPSTPLTDGARWWVPHNRWDLVPWDATSVPRDRCAVIVPYFEQPQSLERMYAAIAVADLDPSVYELIVVDDGSAVAAPAPPSWLGIPARVLRQPDLGCRPGAARHLGATSTDADVLVFLDADTLPTRPAIEALADRVRLLPDALVVGSRAHADLEGWSGEDTSAWLTGEGPAPQRREDPAWLADAYQRTRNLLDADERSFRFIISGVMACGRLLYDDIGGFDTDRAEYGGEDWEFAARAFNHGAVLMHQPLAVAWHDEPDWAERSPDQVAKNDESMWLATNITDPATRGLGVIHEHADIATHIEFSRPLSSVIATVQALLAAAPDQRIDLPADLAESAWRFFGADPRIRRRPAANRPFSPPQGARTILPVDSVRGSTSRARVTMTVASPFQWSPSLLHEALAMLRPGGVGVVRISAGDDVGATLVSTRATGRARRASAYGLDPQRVTAALFGTETIDLASPAAAGCTARGETGSDRNTGGNAEIDIAAWFDRMTRTAAMPGRGR